MKTVYAHFNIETDGGVLLKNNMISLGIVFTDLSGLEINNFTADINPIEGHFPDNNTLETLWYNNNDNLKEYQRIMSNGKPVNSVMGRLSQLLAEYKSKNIKICWVSRLASFEWPWLKNYYDVYCPEYITLETGVVIKSPDIGFKSECLSSIWNLYCKINKLNSNDINKEWMVVSDFYVSTHNVLDNCKMQSKVFHNLHNKMNIKLN
jgi:hypothetical protein